MKPKRLCCPKDTRWIAENKVLKRKSHSNLSPEYQYLHHQIVYQSPKYESHPLALEDKSMKGEYLESKKRFLGNLWIGLILYCFGIMVFGMSCWTNRVLYLTTLYNHICLGFRRFKRIIGIKR